ncbi:MAG: ABC transporter ATP-binding protein [Gammaproteobacteria bacterium]|nr:ABC transporter ATP-binding protein [Gammaproteobacteria bacterium]
MIDVVEIGVRRGTRSVLSDISCHLAAGEMLGVCGPNGAGKSTLLRCLAGLEKPNVGTIQLHNRMLAEIKPLVRAKEIGYLPQHPALAWPLTVAQVVTLGRFPHHHGWHSLDPDNTAIVASVMHDMDLTGLAERPLATLSGGEQMRVHVARLMAGQHSIVLADEPTASLDPRYQIEIIEHLKHAAGSGVAVAVVLHDLPLAARYCSRILVLDQGQIVASGGPTEALSEQILRQTFRVSAVRDPDTHGLIGLAAG